MTNWSYEQCRKCPEMEIANKRIDNVFTHLQSLTEELNQCIEDLRKVNLEFTKAVTSMTERLRAGNEKFTDIDNRISKICDDLNVAEEKASRANARLDTFLRMFLLIGGAIISTAGILISLHDFFGK